MVDFFKLKMATLLLSLSLMVSGCASQPDAPGYRPTQAQMGEYMSRARSYCSEKSGDTESSQYGDCVQARYHLILAAYHGAWHADTYPFGMQDAEDTTIPPRSGREISKISQGTCFFVSGNGEVVTNYHVVEDSSVFEVIDSKGTKFTATLTAKDPANDLAVLQVSSLNHRYLSIAPFGSLKTGQYIFAVGYPASSILGTEVKFTDGVVSSMTGIQNTANTFQMTVPIQPGNSGGPVLNEKGQVVGVATSTAAIEAFLRGTGSLPQNVNWAVKSEYLALLTGIKPSDASQGSREEAIHAAINASCMVKAQ